VPAVDVPVSKVYDIGFRFEARGVGYRILGVRSRVTGLDTWGSRGQGLGLRFWVQGLGFRV
jgi:hypothetical protein